MKTIGLIGGISVESTLEYYKLINEETKRRLGKANAPKLLINSINFQEVADLQHQGKWSALENLMIEAGLTLENAGADFILICSNLMHKTLPAMQEQISVPFLHIADATGEVVKKAGHKKVLLLGAIYTMEDGFYQERLESKWDLDVVTPEPEDRKIISSIIYDELCSGIFKPESKQEYLRVINKAADEGVDAALLSCTEIPLLVKDGEAKIPLFETTKIHALAAVDAALSNVLIYK